MTGGLGTGRDRPLRTERPAVAPAADRRVPFFRWDRHACEVIRRRPRWIASAGRHDATKNSNRTAVREIRHHRSYCRNEQP